MAIKNINLLEDSPTEGNQEVSAKDLRQAVRLADEMRSIGRTITRLEEELKRQNQRMELIEMDLLPNLMLAIGMSSFKLDTGEMITIKDNVRGSIPSLTAIEKADGPDKQVLMDRRDQCLAWLRLNGAEALIKSTVTAEFGKGQEALADQLYSTIIQKGYQAKKDANVNFQTLNAFFREALTKGINIPSEPFALFVGKKAEIKAPKI